MQNFVATLVGGFAALLLGTILITDHVHGEWQSLACMCLGLVVSAVPAYNLGRVMAKKSDKTPR